MSAKKPWMPSGKPFARLAEPTPILILFFKVLFFKVLFFEGQHKAEITGPVAADQEAGWHHLTR